MANLDKSLVAIIPDNVALHTYLSFYDTRHDMVNIMDKTGRCKLGNQVHRSCLGSVNAFKPLVSNNQIDKHEDEENIVMQRLAAANDEFAFEHCPEISYAEVIVDDLAARAKGQRTDEEFMTPDELQILKDHDSKFVKIVIAKECDKYPYYISEALRTRFGNNAQHKLNIHTDYITIYFYRDHTTGLPLQVDYQQKINSLAAYWDEASKDNKNSVDELSLPLSQNSISLKPDMFMPPGYSMDIKMLTDPGTNQNMLEIQLEIQPEIRLGVDKNTVHVTSSSDPSVSSYNILDKSNHVSLSVQSLCNYINAMSMPHAHQQDNALVALINNFINNIDDTHKQAVFANICYNLKRSLDYLQVYMVQSVNEKLKEGAPSSSASATEMATHPNHILQTGDRLCFMKAVMKNAPAIFERRLKLRRQCELIVFTGNIEPKVAGKTKPLHMLLQRIHGKNLETPATYEKHIVELRTYMNTLEVLDAVVPNSHPRTYGEMVETIQDICYNVFYSCLAAYKAAIDNIVTGDLPQEDQAELALVECLQNIKAVHSFITTNLRRFKGENWKKRFSVNFNVPAFNQFNNIEWNGDYRINITNKALTSLHVDGYMFVRYFKDHMRSYIVTADSSVEVRDKNGPFHSLDPLGVFNSIIARVMKLTSFTINDLRRYPYHDPTKKRGPPKGYTDGSERVINIFTRYKDVVDHVRGMALKIQAANQESNEPAQRSTRINIVNLNKLVSKKFQAVLQSVSPTKYDEAAKLLGEIKAIQLKYKGKRNLSAQEQRQSDLEALFYEIAALITQFVAPFNSAYNQAFTPLINNFQMLLQQVFYHLDLGVNSESEYKGIMTAITDKLEADLLAEVFSMSKFLDDYIKTAESCLTTLNAPYNTPTNPVSEFHEKLLILETTNVNASGPNKKKARIEDPLTPLQPILASEFEAPEVELIHQQYLQQSPNETTVSLFDRIASFIGRVKGWLGIGPIAPIVQGEEGAASGPRGGAKTRKANSGRSGSSDIQQTPGPDVNEVMSPATLVDYEQFDWEALEEAKQLLILRCLFLFMDDEPAVKNFVNVENDGDIESFFQDPETTAPEKVLGGDLNQQNKLQTSATIQARVLAKLAADFQRSMQANLL